MSVVMTVADVAVIGAGPAGSWAAYCLASRGARVTIFDPSHPREKPCGGGVTGRALQLVAAAVPAATLAATRVERARFVDSAAGVSTAVPLQSKALVVASRASFDGRLLDAAQRAGARLVRSRVNGVSPDGNGFRIAAADGAAVRASFLIGADGANSFVRRQVAQPFSRRQLSIATGFFVHGATSDEIVIELVGDPPGYIWSFPRPDHLAVGVCAQAHVAGASAACLRAQTRRWIEATGIGAGGRLAAYSWPIPSLTARDMDRLAMAGSRWLLVGDAAGFVDPITREGIFFALQSAGYAADAIGGDRQPDLAYSARVRDAIVPELARAARFKEGFFRPRFTRMLVDALRTSEPIRQVMADLVAGTQSYRGLRWRLAKTLEWKLAFRALRAGRGEALSD
jgi:geranylgeranyl reductase family protein